jgi:hypothetical protein
MTAYDLTSAIAFTSPLFIAIGEGKNHGLLGIVAGIFVGSFFGFIACVAFRKAGNIIFIRFFRNQTRRGVLYEIVGFLFYPTMFVWVLVCAAAAMFVMKAIP